MFWQLKKAIFGPEKDKWWIWGSKTPKPPEMPIKLGKTSQHHNWPRYMDWPQIVPKIAIKQGKKTPKGQMVPISRAQQGVFAFVCQYIVSPCGRTGNQTVTPNCKKGKGHQNRAPSLLEPRVFFQSFLEPRLERPRASSRAP